jgi:hypothetical protein
LGKALKFFKEGAVFALDERFEETFPFAVVETTFLGPNQ